jgi:tetratricopeptide (TPR) repeat protein
MLISGTLVTLVGLFRLLPGGDGGLYARLLTGPFGYPNAMAGFLILTGGAALAMARENQGPVSRAGVMAAGALVAAGLILTRSRGALLASGAGLVLWAALERRTWWSWRRLWLWLGGVGFLALLVWVARPSGSLLPTLGALATRLEDPSILWRQQILQWTWAMARDHPWWGVGPGAFPVALTQYQRLPYVSGENPHNLYVELAAEYGLPAGILAMLALGGFLGRVGAAIWHAPAEDPVRRRLAALVAALVAFAVHSLVDLDWSFPAIAVTVATMLGLASAHHRGKGLWGSRATPLWRSSLLLLLAAAAVLSLTRYYASTLVTWARLALATEEMATARRDLTWALRLNPLSFPAHHWMAWARLRSGDPRGAAEIAERAVRIAPSDPNSQYLVGEIAAASGRWDAAEERFRAAAELAPSAQLRFHAGLVEAAARGGRAAEARFRYERAAAIFTPERVLEGEARCLAPGDRYLMARMSRIASRLYEEAGDPPKQQATTDRARLLAQPDPRGICVTRGRPGQTSPEAATESFWRALSEGGWPQAEPFLAPGLRATRSGDDRAWWRTGDRPRRANLAWVAALHGGEREASLRFEVEIEVAPNRRIPRCAHADLRLIGEHWFVDRLPVPEPEPCQP